MKNIVVASENPVKLQATLDGFKRMFPDEEFAITGVAVESGVSDQPVNDAETYQGAYNRALNAGKAVPDADFWVGLEGGIEAKGEDMEAYAWILVRSRTGQMGKGKTGVFFLPPKIAGLVSQGIELSHADDMVFGRTNSKHSNGAIGLLTNDVIDRTRYYAEAVVFALIPFKNPDLYKYS
jgi:inosine/xanthosine triphosphatase